MPKRLLKFTWVGPEHVTLIHGWTKEKELVKKRTFINQYKTEIIPSGIFLVDFAEGWCEVESTKE